MPRPLLRPTLLLRLLPAWLVLVALRPAPAAAFNQFEQTFGVSNINAVGGHGGLTVGVSQEGDLSVLSWPGPSQYDQLAYVTSNAPDARAQPHLSALDGMGSYLGFRVTTAQGTGVVWLRDAGWTRTQSYSQSYSPVPVTRFESAALALSVELTDIVAPEQDVLRRQVRVERHPLSPVIGLDLLVYENLSPTLSNLPELPVADWLLDANNDFLAVWDQASRAILHFHPGDFGTVRSIPEYLDRPRDLAYGPVETLMRSAHPSAEQVQSFVEALDHSYSPGVTALVTTLPAPSQFQVGLDATPLCKRVDELADNLLAFPTRFPGADIQIDPAAAGLLRCTDALPGVAERKNWQWSPQDALADLSDGELSGSQVAAAQTNGALKASLVFNADIAEASVFFAFGNNRAEARAALEAVEAQSAHALQAAAEEAALAAVGHAPMPSPELGERVTAVAQRALVNIYVARERKTGALLASVSRQPSYCLDWARDGAFISVALDLAGQTGFVSQRDRWYATLLRAEPTTADPLLTPKVPFDPISGKQQFPADVWEMNYFGDGTRGGPIRFEIDNTALHLWGLVEHLAHLPEEERRPLAEELWPSTRRAAELLARWREPDTHLPAPANEDDDFSLTSTLQSAVTVYPALVSSARLARYVGDTEAMQRYLDAAAEVKEATLSHYVDPDTGLFRVRRRGAGGPEGEVTSWVSWPGRLLPPQDARLEAQRVADLDGKVLPFLRGEVSSAAYLGKAVIPAALYGKPDGARAKAREAVLGLAEVATDGTFHFGERFESHLQPEGRVTFSVETATPHVWEGALFYLAAMALTSPESFNADERVFPLPGEQKTGCGCDGAPSPVTALALLALAAWMARRQRPAPAEPQGDTAGSGPTLGHWVARRRPSSVRRA